MAQRALRFGIRDDTGRRAATWKLWTEPSGGRSDIYLASRSLGGSLKASLHQSGKWHYAYSPATFERRVRNALPRQDTRFIETWQRPPEIGPGTTLAFRILTPASAVVTTPVSGSHRTGMIWLPNAPPNSATEIDIFIVRPGTRVTGWPGKRSMGTSLVGSIPLESGETVWAVHWVIPMPDFSKMPSHFGGFYKGASKQDLLSGDIRALAFGKEPDGSRVFYDCAVKVTPRVEAKSSEAS